MAKYLLLTLLTIFCSLVFAQDNIIVPANSGRAYLKANDGNLYPVTVSYTTNGDGDIEPIEGGGTSYTFTAPLSFNAGVVSIPSATSLIDGYLSHADYVTFSGKQQAGNYITALTSDVTATGPGSVAATVNSVGTSSAANIHSAELAANAATNICTASTIVKRDASCGFIAGIIKAGSTQKIEFGTLDAFSRPQIWNYEAGGDGAVLRLGSWVSDGDATNVKSAGIVSYGPSLLGTPISNSDGSYARIKYNRFGLFNIDSTLPAYASGDYYYRIDDTQMFYKDNSANIKFSVQRTSGNITSGSINSTAKNFSVAGSTVINSNTITVADATGIIPGMWVSDSAGAFRNSNFSPVLVESMYIVNSVAGNNIVLNYNAVSTQASDTFTFSEQGWITANYGVTNRGFSVGTSDGFGRPTIKWTAPNNIVKLGEWGVDGDPNNIPSQGLVMYFNSISGAPIDSQNGSIQLIGQNWLWFANSEAGNMQTWFNVDPTSFYYADPAGNVKFSVQSTSGNTTIAGLLTLPVQTLGNTPTGVNGSIALTSTYIMCVYNGSSWVKTADGSTVCTF